jgi:serine phosphatase RsbU (regulator of sigma subunit)
VLTNGDLSRFVPIATRDEFSVIAINTNKMIHGLRDRIRMLTRLTVAKEVQKILIEDLNNFRNHLPIEDDITIVIVKFLKKR